MASTARETAEGHEQPERPDRTPGPDMHRALVCVVLAASLPISAGFALAGAWMVLPFAGLELALAFLVLRSLPQRAAPFSRMRTQGDRLIAASHRPARPHFSTARACISREAQGLTEPRRCIVKRGHGAHLGQLITPQTRRRFAFEPANGLPQQARRSSRKRKR